jgi:hypothetical protein
VDAKALGNMMLFIVGFLLLWAAMRMAYALARPTLAQVSPDAAQAADFVLF